MTVTQLFGWFGAEQDARTNDTRGDRMKRQSINPDSMYVRKRGGNVMMAQIVTVENASRYIFLSGQLARGLNGECVGKGDMRAQLVQVGENIKAGLEAVGCTLDDIVKTNTFVTDMDEFLKHPDLRLQYLGKDLPTSTTVEVRRLVHPDFMIEVDVVAAT
jgi:enamine deaminase RidA (YjgF/YER057c/UK114 family)